MARIGEEHGIVDRIYNGPLSLLNGTELYSVVKLFHINHINNEVDLITFQRGAYLVRDRETFMEHGIGEPIPSQHARTPAEEDGEVDQGARILDPEFKVRTHREDEALRNEMSGAFASLTKDAVLTLATCALGAFVQGWSQENIVGANRFWPVEFDEDPKGIVFALVNAITYFTASLCGIWLTDPLSSYLGRRGALLCSAICSFVAPVGAAGSNNWETLIVFRVIQGLSMGAKGAVIPVLMSEVSPPALRAQILVAWQTFVALGILVGAIVNYFLSTAQTWRWALGISAVPALTFAALCYAIPESPRWLIEQCEYAKAYRSLRRLRTTELQAAGELYLLYTYNCVYSAGNNILRASDLQRLLETPPSRSTKSPYVDFLRRFRDLFGDDRNRRAALAACTVMAAQQMSGINIFAFVARPGDGNVMSADIKVGFGIVNTVFSAAAYVLIQPLGRRTLLLASLAAMLPPLIVLACLADSSQMDASRVVPVTFVLIYTACYSPGAGVIPFMYSSEVYGQKHRQAGMSLAVATNFALCGVVAIASLTAPSATLEDKWQPAIIFFVVTDALAIVLVWLFMRTEGLRASSLEDMHELFAQPLRLWVRYQVREVIPKTFARGKAKRTFRQWCRDEAVMADLTQDRSVVPGDLEFSEVQRRS